MPTTDHRPALSVRAAGATDIGYNRTHNEDTVLLRDDFHLYVVADGAGGHQAGNVASALATTAIADFFETTRAYAETLPEYDAFGFSTGARRLAQAIQRANRDVIEIAKTSKRHRGMGTTVVAAWLRPHHGAIHIGHVGDSRCYRYRAGQIEPLTHDHSLYNDVLELHPSMPEAALARLPRNVVTRAIGMEDVVRVSLRTRRLIPGDKYLLCSDGLTDGVSELEMAQAFEEGSTPDDVVRLLIARAKAAQTQDNIAALVVFSELSSGEGQPRSNTSPYMPSAFASPPVPSRTTTTEGSSPEIMIVGTQSAEDDGQGIHVVPQGSASEGFLSAIDSLVGPMRARSLSSPRVASLTCFACQAVLANDDITCPQCNAPQPLEP